MKDNINLRDKYRQKSTFVDAAQRLFGVVCLICEIRKGQKASKQTNNYRVEKERRDRKQNRKREQINTDKGEMDKQRREIRENQTKQRWTYKEQK